MEGSIEHKILAEQSFDQIKLIAYHPIAKVKVTNPWWRLGEYRVCADKEGTEILVNVLNAFEFRDLSTILYQVARGSGAGVQDQIISVSREKDSLIFIDAEGRDCSITLDQGRRILYFYAKNFLDYAYTLCSKDEHIQQINDVEESLNHFAEECGV